MQTKNTKNARLSFDHPLEVIEGGAQAIRKIPGQLKYVYDLVLLMSNSQYSSDSLSSTHILILRGMEVRVGG